MCLWLSIEGGLLHKRGNENSGIDSSDQLRGVVYAAFYVEVSAGFFTGDTYRQLPGTIPEPVYPEKYTDLESLPEQGGGRI